MPALRFLLFLVAFSLLSICLSAQEATSTSSAPAARDPQGVSLLQQAIAAMTPTPPADTTATGTVTITAGSETTKGAVKIMTRGSSETSIQFQTPDSTWSIIYANGQANRVESNGATVLPLELAASSRCLYLPQPFLSDLLNNQDISIRLIGQESLGLAPVNHIRAQNTFNSTPTNQFLSEFTVADIWLDAASALPIKISMTRRYGGGSSPRIPISVVYSNYQTISGMRYPFTIREYWTETLWATTTIQSVTFNSGLTDASFPIVMEGN